ncbi:MAG: hypothetical protein V7K18_23010 [Nostoc sp.]|uniref:hypothetical protein n=1 Tax=Nostoc sp. TaxID=1180 RepID=UPI002FFCE902
MDIVIGNVGFRFLDVAVEMLGIVPQPNLQLSLIWSLTTSLVHLRSHSASLSSLVRCHKGQRTII